MNLKHEKSGGCLTAAAGKEGKMKRLAAILMALVMAAALAGCSGPDGGQTQAPETGAAGGTGETEAGTQEAEVNTEITGTVTVGINSYRNSDFEAVCAAFNERYPNITIEPILFESDSDDATEYLTSQAMAGKALPDIMYDDAGPIPTYIQNGWMYPLTEFVQDDEEFALVPQSVVDRFTYGDNIYALGQTMRSNVLLINTDLVEELNVDLPELDWNWDDFTQFIQACTNSSYSGVEDLSEQYNWIPGAMTEGRSVIGYDPETGTFDLESVQKFVNYYQEISRLGGVEATSLKQNSQSGESDYVRKFGDVSGRDAAFIAGKVASTFTGTWLYASWMQQDLDFNWEMYPVPQCVPGRIPVHIDYCWMTTSVAEENVEAAWTFLRFVTYSKEGNLARLTTYDEDHITADMYNTYYIPCTYDEDVAEKFKSLPYVTEEIIYIYDNQENGYMADPEKTVPGFETVEYQTIGKIAYESISGMYDFTSYMADAEQKANQEIVEYQQLFDEALAKFEQEFAASH